MGLILDHLDIILKQFNRMIDPNAVAVEHQVIVFLLPPLHVRIIIVIGRTFFVRFQNSFLSVRRLQVVIIFRPRDPMVDIGINEDIDTVRMICQHIIGTASDDDARTLCRNLADYVRLNQE